ncbi:MAG: 3'-5' exoribonuclease YhaM family protein [Phycisphaerae bacterium]
MNTERLYIDQLLANQAVDQVFLVREKDLRTTKRGDYYISATLVDKTGTISARMWQANETIFQSIPVDGFLQVKGRCEEYRGAIQMVIDACRPISSEKVDLGDFLPISGNDIEEMWSELLEILRTIQDPHIRLLIKQFVEDTDLVAAFKRAPAAMQMHHPFVGGLLEHTLNLARAAKVLLPLYPKVNGDLVLAGVLLHDIAKTAELASEVTIKYTDRGRLVGHITLAALWIADKARQVAEETGEDFPQRTLDLLQHMILAHHGVHEYGSPKLPMIPEAFFLHYIDNLDAKMWMTTNAIESDSDPESNFTPYIRSLETAIYKHSQTL